MMLRLVRTFCAFAFIVFNALPAFSQESQCVSEPAMMGAVSYAESLWKADNNRDVSAPQKQFANALCKSGCWAYCKIEGATDVRTSEVKTLQDQCLQKDENACRKLLAGVKGAFDRKNESAVLCLLVGGSKCEVTGLNQTTQLMVEALNCKTNQKCEQIDKVRAQLKVQRERQELANKEVSFATAGGCKDLTTEQCESAAKILFDERKLEQAVDLQIGVCVKASELNQSCEKVKQYTGGIPALQDQLRLKFKKYCPNEKIVSIACYYSVDHFNQQDFLEKKRRWCFANSQSGDNKQLKIGLCKDVAAAAMGQKNSGEVMRAKKKICSLLHASDKKQYEQCIKPRS